MTPRMLAAGLLVASLVPVCAAAQDTSRPQNPRTPTPRAVQPAAPTPSAPTELGSGRRLRGRDVNVQIELTITDYSASGAPDKKVVSVTTADRTMGRIRTGAGDTMLNIDATPSLTTNDRIVLELTVVYAPPVPPTGSTGASARPATVNEMLSVILHDGRSMMVSQAADPTTARRMTVEVKASILK
jgi:hypothetical protein